MATMYSPLGHAIIGTLENIGGVAGVTFADLPGDKLEFAHTGDNETWDGDTVLIADAPVFRDDNGSTWLAHHLLTEEEAEGLTVPPALVGAMRAEYSIGERLEAARALKVLIGGDATTSAAAEQAAWIFVSLDKAYGAAKDIVLASLAECRAPKVDIAAPPPPAGKLRTFQFDAAEPSSQSLFTEDLVASSREEAEATALVVLADAWGEEYAFSTWDEARDQRGLHVELLEFDTVIPTREESGKMADLVRELATAEITPAAMTELIRKARKLAPAAPQEN